MMETAVPKPDEDKKSLSKEEFYKFLAREDSFSDIELVKLKDLAHVAPIIEF